MPREVLDRRGVVLRLVPAALRTVHRLRGCVPPAGKAVRYLAARAHQLLIPPSCITWPLSCESEQSEAGQRGDFEGSFREGSARVQGVITHASWSRSSAARCSSTRRRSAGSREGVPLGLTVRPASTASSAPSG